MTDTSSSSSQAVVAPGEEGERLDRWLALRFPEISRARFQGLIADSRVTVEGRSASNPRQKMKVGERVAFDLPPAIPAEPKGEAMTLDILYEDDQLIVLDKPAGLVVHPGAGHGAGTLVNALIAHCGDSLSGIGGVARPGIVHRLDKDTSGLLVVAKTDKAHASLSEQFAAHGRDGRLERAYLALAWGIFDRPRRSISAPLARSTANRQKIAVSRSANAREAITHYEVLETYAGPPPVSLVRCVLETGRTHQIRVHMAHIGHPLLGDATYGTGFAASSRRLPIEAREALDALDRQALHAAVLGFNHPSTGESMRFQSPLPADMAALVTVLRGNGLGI